MRRDFFNVLFYSRIGRFKGRSQGHIFEKKPWISWVLTATVEILDKIKIYSPKLCYPHKFGNADNRNLLGKEIWEILAAW